MQMLRAVEASTFTLKEWAAGACISCAMLVFVGFIAALESILELIIKNTLG